MFFFYVKLLTGGAQSTPPILKPFIIFIIPVI